MNNKTKTITLITLLTLSSFGLLFSTLFTPAAASYNSFQPLEEIALMDLTHENFAEKEARASEVEPIGLPSGQPAEVGDVFVFAVSDDGLGIDYDETFVIVEEGDHILILVTQDAYDFYQDNNFYNFSNPIGDDSEPWMRYGDVITDEMLDYMVDEFDNNMYPTMAGIFGVPASRPSNPADPDYDEFDKDKIWTLIFNIRDEAYYDPDATSYIAGYFSLSDDNKYQKNMMHIDTFEWERRCGDADNPWFEPLHPRARPNLYEGTFAHEYEHMIHADIDPDEPSWVDEGLADLASFLCGYGHSVSHVYYYLIYHPITSLTFWGGGLEDYGASYLFQLYLYEKYGGEDFVTALVQEQANGIEGIEKTLRSRGYWWARFKNIFDDWTIANYLDDDLHYGGKYGYDTLEIGTYEHTRGYSIEYALMNFFWGPPDQGDFEIESGWWDLPIWGVDWGFEPQPYTAHYYRFNNPRLSTLYMDGEDFAGTLPYSGAYEWYSDAAAWGWQSFYQTFTIPDGGATLNFMTFFEIEDDWDYCYVEVYDHFNGEWYTLDAAGTVDYIAHEQDNPNTPDGREPTDYLAAGRWHAFTGFSGDWMPISMDLTPFAGHDIDLYFTLWQDGAYTEQMMYVDDISITEIGFFDDVEAGEGDWASTGWYIFDGIFENGWDVTVIRVQDVPYWRYPTPEEMDAVKMTWRRGMIVNQGTQSGEMWVWPAKVEKGRVQVAIVSNHADHILTSSYVLRVEEFVWNWWHWW